jgi:2-amino-4-hydroxy-6-hydroxymethyldihydropteridine diphosphokinase
VPHRVYIGIGSNLGDRRANTIEAIGRVKELPTTKVVRSSSLYESEPLGDAKTWFVNSVIELETELQPAQLLKQLQAIEQAMGRKRVKGKRWGSRIIDLDILLVDQDVVAKRSLKIPHPEMHKRRFVLLPLAELAPHVIHPQLGHSVSTLLATVKDPKRVTLLIRPEPRMASNGGARTERSLGPAGGMSPATKPARHT